MSQRGALGQYALGQLPPVINYYTMAADAGAYTLTGQTAGLQRGLKVTAAVGTYTLTGQAAAFARTRAVVASVGSYTLTGQAAILRQAHVLVASHLWSTGGSSSSYPLFAALGEVSLGGSRTVTFAAPTTTYAYNGYNTVLRRGFSMPAAAGAYTLTGQDAGQRRTYAVQATVGTYTLTGQAASFALTMPAAVGTYTLTGQNTAFQIGRKRIRGFTGSRPSMAAFGGSRPAIIGRAA